MCRDAGIKAHPSTPKEWLIGYLTGEYPPPPVDETTHPIDRWRVALIGFILDHWKQLNPQLKCPAKNLKNPDPSKQDSRPCFGCPDMTVMYCVTDNANNEDRIRLYQPRRSK